MSRRRERVAVAVLAGTFIAGLSSRPAGADELYEYGEYLSSECTTCHLLSGQTEGIPSITNWPVDSFMLVLRAYKNGARDNQAMQSVTKRLSEEDMKALAFFFHEQGRKE